MKSAIHCDLVTKYMAPGILVNTDSGNGFYDNTKPLPEISLVYHQIDQ